MIHTEVDSLFFQHIGTIENAFSSLGNSQPDLARYRRITNSLHQLYLALIHPPENRLDDKNLVIIPDGELAKIPFDALLTSPVVNENRINFAALSYLLYQYRISYAYSASLLCRNRGNDFIPKHIYAFAPSYGSGTEDQTRAGFGNLQAIFQEIEGIGKWFSQCQFISGQQASKRSFRSVSRDNAILHLAMHASVNKDNHNHSYLAFSNQDSMLYDSRLYNYEISLMDIRSPLVVLSACNTGDGAIIRGEGTMSLHRGFLLAGVPSVVHTLWSVEDASSARIMENFYKYLAEGKDKREALHLAKIEYIKTMPPTLVNPYFWSGYALSGDYSQINQPGFFQNIYCITALVLFSVFFMLYFCSRQSSLRRRFAAFSR
jgi:CHAT domain-containing protein